LWGKRKRVNDEWKFEPIIDNNKLYITITETKKMMIQPEDSPVIDNIEKIIELITNTASLSYRNDKSPHTTHATNMLERIIEFDIEHEIDRCAIIILVDAAIEILLRAKIDQITSKDKLRINSKYITKRNELYEAIEDNNYILPVKEDLDKIRSKIRNDVMHLGKIPTIQTTQYCIDILKKLLRF